mgnify:CR=1 FL=1
MRSERIVVLGSPDFKAYLTREASEEGISVSELIRRRCERKPTDDEAAVIALAQELTLAVKEAETSLADGLEAASAALMELRASKGKLAA